MNKYPFMSVSIRFYLIILTFLQKQKGRTVFLLKNKAKKVRKMNPRKTFPVLEKSKR